MSRLMLSMASWFTLVMLLTCPPGLSIWTMTGTRFTSLRPIWSAANCAIVIGSDFRCVSQRVGKYDGSYRKDK
jgi:hypothetical protein